MSYSSRVYRQRNTNSPDALKKKAFFSGKDKQDKDHTNAAEKDPSQDPLEREADVVANSVVNEKGGSPVIQNQQVSSIQKLATPKEDERTSTNEERMKEDKDVQEKPIQRMEGEKKEEDKVQKQEAKDEEKLKDEGVQKQEAKGEEKLKDEGVQKKEEGEPEKEEKESTTPVQPKHNTTAENTAQVRTKYLHDTKGKGSMLPKDTLDEMNAKFAYDFKDVRIHDDSDAHEMSQDLNAQAFTRGNDIYFNEGKYDPSSPEGKLLLAHELTHVIQQKGTEE
jgi:hypothetical protein